MEAAFWQERWRQNRIGFHRAETNPLLARFAQTLAGAGAPGRVFVPFCGKSRDMTFLASQGFTVTGNELVEDALRAFYEEQQIPFTRSEEGDFTALEGAGLRTYAGDFFALRPERLGPLDGIYDCAALVALPPEMRRRYAAHLLGFLRPGGRMLLVSFEYDQAKMPGPPFSVPRAEIEALYGQACEIALLGEQDVLASRPDWRARGLSSMAESAFLLTRR
jgi:thiopurine S-methyltransferase